MCRSWSPGGTARDGERGRRAKEQGTACPGPWPGPRVCLSQEEDSIRLGLGPGLGPGLPSAPPWPGLRGPQNGPEPFGLVQGIIRGAHSEEISRDNRRRLPVALRLGQTSKCRSHSDQEALRGTPPPACEWSCGTGREPAPLHHAAPRGLQFPVGKHAFPSLA